MAGADLHLTQGVPFTREYRFVGAALLWPDAAGCEARSHLISVPRFDFGPYLSDPVVDELDLVVVLSMTGQQTRLLPSGGNYDLFLSDTAPEDARAIRVAGRVYLTLAFTSG